jgi:hypothetical protein
MPPRPFARTPLDVIVGLALIVGMAIVPGCRKGVPAGPAAAADGAGKETGKAPSPPAADPALERLFAAIAGLPSGDPFLWEAEAPWQAFAGLADRDWAGFEDAVLRPMGSWAEAELKDPRRATATLFYPFGGPDLVTASAFFPEARDTVLLGLEPVGNLPSFDKAPAAWREEFFSDLGALVSGFLKRGYFITREMNDVYSRGRVDGALPVIAFFLGREGCRIVDVRRLVPDPQGEWIESPCERLTVRPRRPYGVKIAYLKEGESAVRNVYYLSCDVEDKALRVETPLYRLFAGFARLTSFVKSGSYLLHWSNFSNLRRFILDRSLFVLQDDSAVPYRFFVNAGWEIRLFGRYGKPVTDFKNVEQPDLRRAYEDPDGGVEPLPFHFGYHWRSQVDNLLLAVRPRRPYKVPIDK